jgi:hypothetical protein
MRSRCDLFEIELAFGPRANVTARLTGSRRASTLKGDIAAWTARPRRVLPLPKRGKPALESLYRLLARDATSASTSSDPVLCSGR